MNFLVILEIIFFTYAVALLITHQIIYKKYRKKRHMGGKTVVITGGSTGLGAYIGIELIKKGAKVIITGRNSDNVKDSIKKAITDLKFYSYIQGELNQKETAERLKALENGKWIDNGKNFYSEFLHYRYIDQLDLGSCREFSSWVNKNFQYIDILVNNAGAAILKKRLSNQDLEATMAINHFSHVLITHDLLPLLKKSKQARIINTSSEGHNLKKVVRDLKIPVDDICCEKIEYSAFPVYCRSKLANVLFTNSLQKFLSKKKYDISTFSFHPGAVFTELFREGGFLISLGMHFLKPFLRTPFEGSQTGIFLSCENYVDLKGGEYYDNNGIGKMNTDARDQDYCGKFWNKSLDILESKLGEKLCNFERLEVK